MRVPLLPMVWQLVLALSLTLGSWPSVIAASALERDADGALAMTVDPPPCHDEPQVASPEPALSSCCDGPCVETGCAPAMCGASQAAAVPMRFVAHLPTAAFLGGPPSAVPRTVPPPVCEPLRPPIA